MLVDARALRRGRFRDRDLPVAVVLSQHLIQWRQVCNGRGPEFTSGMLLEEGA